jgi:molybdopterin-guanine dinucleotide biosynthesis protein A
VGRLDAGALLGDPALAAVDPDLDSLLNINEPADYEAARARPAPAVTVRVGGAVRRVNAATVAEAAAAGGLSLDGHVVAALNGEQPTRDPQTPLVAGDSVAFVPAKMGRGIG